MEQSTIERQPASKYLKQVAKVVNKKLTDEEKAELLSKLMPPDDENINAELIYYMVRSLEAPKGSLAEKRLNKDMSYLMRMTDVDMALYSWKDGENYQAHYVWTGHYKQLGRDKKPIKREYTQTFDQTPRKELLDEYSKVAVSDLKKKRGKLDYVDYSVYILDIEGRPLLGTMPHPVEFV